MRWVGWGLGTEEVRRWPRTTVEGGEVGLGWVAGMRDRHEETGVYTRFNHEPAIGLVISKQSDANTVTTAKAVAEKIERVKRRIGYEDLTQTARLELPFAVDQVVKDKEPEFVQFFNTSISISPKLHMLHLLPGIGKKLMWEILEEREKKPFESFGEISQRIKSIPNPAKMIASRVLEELQDPNVKYHIFTTR